jgi:DivIVA domain-containing protein
MDITAATVRKAQFRQAWKGYDTAEVDDFLDDVAEGVAALQEQVNDLSTRLETMEDRALKAEARPALRSEPDESVRRTLVLAQRAADLVVSEAKSVGDRIVSDARDQAAKLVHAAQVDAENVHVDATAKAEHVVADAEAAAARITAVRAAELQTSLNGLVEEQARRKSELEQIGVAIERAKAQFRGLLTAQLEQLDTTHQAVGASPDMSRQVEDALARAGSTDPGTPSHD